MADIELYIKWEGIRPVFTLYTCTKPELIKRPST